MADPIRIRCVRCGNWHTREPGDPYLPWLCSSCFSKGMDVMFGPGGADDNLRRFDAWRARWWKNVEGHPTDRALNDAWDAAYGATTPSSREVAS
jgi:hypothetical protein